jgi:hypothetical protein
MSENPHPKGTLAYDQWRLREAMLDLAFELIWPIRCLLSRDPTSGLRPWARERYEKRIKA